MPFPSTSETTSPSLILVIFQRLLNSRLTVPARPSTKLRVR